MTHSERRIAYSEYINAIRSGDSKKAHESLLKAFDIKPDDITMYCDSAVGKPIEVQENMLIDMSEDLRDFRDYTHINTPRQNMMSVFTDMSDIETNKDYTILP